MNHDEDSTDHEQFWDLWDSDREAAITMLADSYDYALLQEVLVELSPLIPGGDHDDPQVDPELDSLCRSISRRLTEIEDTHSPDDIEH